MRIQNEGTGKSSWWVINPDAKPGEEWKTLETYASTSAILTGSSGSVHVKQPSIYLCAFRSELKTKSEAIVRLA